MTSLNSIVARYFIPWFNLSFLLFFFSMGDANRSLYSVGHWIKCEQSPLSRMSLIASQNSTEI